MIFRWPTGCTMNVFRSSLWDGRLFPRLPSTSYWATFALSLRDLTQHFVPSYYFRVVPPGPYPALRTGLLSRCRSGTLPSTSYRATTFALSLRDLTQHFVPSYYFRVVAPGPYPALRTELLLSRCHSGTLPTTSYRATVTGSLRAILPSFRSSTFPIPLYSTGSRWICASPRCKLLIRASTPATSPAFRKARIVTLLGYDSSAFRIGNRPAERSKGRGLG
jgi:hypothetical protein